MKILVAGVLLFCWGTTAIQAAESYPELVHHFDYDQKPLSTSGRVGAEIRDGVTVRDISYASPKGGRVPAYLVLPPGQGPYAGTLLGHWAKEGSPVRNRKEFMDEAVALAHAGAVSLLIDAPFARPGFHSDPEPLNSQEPLTEQQQVIDLRRGVDLLCSRREVDPARIAYVGHSFDAAVGGILAGVEHRVQAYVLMAGTFDVARYVHSDDPRIVALRKQGGESNWICISRPGTGWIRHITLATRPWRLPSCSMRTRMSLCRGHSANRTSGCSENQRPSESTRIPITP